MAEYIERKSVEFIDKLLKSGCHKPIGKHSPKGLFYCIEKDGNGKRIYIAVDNSTGDAWTEEFNSVYSCRKYLMDEPCTTSSGEKINL